MWRGNTWVFDQVSWVWKRLLGGWLGEGFRFVSASIGGYGDPFNRCKKAVTAAGQGFDISRLFCRIAQRFTQLIHGGIQSVVEIYEGVGRPKPSPQFFASDQLPRFGQEYCQDFEWLAHQPDPDPLFPELVSVNVGLKPT